MCSMRTPASTSTSVRSPAGGMSVRRRRSTTLTVGHVAVGHRPADVEAPLGSMLVVRMRMAALTAVMAASLLFGTPAHAAVPVLVVTGEGNGHGVGMAQDGAYWM